MIDITKYAMAYKRIKSDSVKGAYALQYFEELFAKTYSAVCLDVDKTIREHEIIDEEMLSIFYELLERNTSLCFITGMGRTKSREVLMQVYRYMKDRKMDVKNITCATSNGAIFLDTSKDFLDSEQVIVSDTILERYTKMKDVLRREYITSVKGLGLVKGDLTEFVSRSIKSSGDMSLRFAFNYDEVEDYDAMTLALKEVLCKTDLAEEISVLKGKHKDKLIWELSIADKLRAVKFFEERYGIKDTDVIKLGDQGKVHGNDFNMLKLYAGFSVDEIESSIPEVLPVMGEDGEIIKGTKATKKLLRDLDFDGER